MISRPSDLKAIERQPHIYTRNNQHELLESEVSSVRAESAAMQQPLLQVSDYPRRSDTETSLTAAGRASEPKPPRVQQNNQSEHSDDSSSSSRISRGLAFRIVICCAAAAITLLPDLSFGWKAHVILATFFSTIVGLIALPEIPGTVLVLCGLSVLGITGAVQDHAFCLVPASSLTSPSSFSLRASHPASSSGPFPAPGIAESSTHNSTLAVKKCSGLWWGFSAGKRI